MRSRIHAVVMTLMMACAAASGAETNVFLNEKVPVLLQGAATGQWTMDLDAARSLSAETKLPILLVFTGSDWCKYCKIAFEEIFSTAEWQEFASNRFVLVNIDIPRGEGLLPTNVLERNRALAETFNVRGYPDFLVLSSGGTNVSHRFGMTPDMNALEFAREASSFFRSDPDQLIRFLEGLPEDKAALYQSSLAGLVAARLELDGWLQGNPAVSESNITVMTTFRIRIETGQRDLEAIERDRYLRDMAGDAAAARAAQLQRAETLVGLASELEAARDDVSNWLLTRPAKTEKEFKKFNLLILRVEKLEADIRRLFTSESNPPLNGAPPAATP